MFEYVWWMVVFVCKRYYFLALVLMNEGRVEGWAETPGEAYLLLSLITQTDSTTTVLDHVRYTHYL